MSDLTGGDDSQILNVYVKPGCPWCINVIQFLKENGYRFKEIDVIADETKMAEMEEISGQTFAPTMRVGKNDDLVLADFGVDELKLFLDQHGIGP
ncbi:MAG: glutaredoxin family protein [Verrucomicrobiales bacterium]|nr:glutaredoxin family protein [Verrucomicrobiales bacterium]